MHQGTRYTVQGTRCRVHGTRYTKGTSRYIKVHQWYPLQLPLLWKFQHGNISLTHHKTTQVCSYSVNPGAFNDKVQQGYVCQRQSGDPPGISHMIFDQWNTLVVNLVEPLSDVCSVLSWVGLKWLRIWWCDTSIISKKVPKSAFWRMHLINFQVTNVKSLSWTTRYWWATSSGSTSGRTSGNTTSAWED